MTEQTTTSAMTSTPGHGMASHAPIPLATFNRWLLRALPGQQLEYHRGLLIRDRSPASELGEDERRAVAQDRRCRLRGRRGRAGPPGAVPKRPVRLQLPGGEGRTCHPAERAHLLCRLGGWPRQLPSRRPRDGAADHHRRRAARRGEQPRPRSRSSGRRVSARPRCSRPCRLRRRSASTSRPA